MAAVVSAPATTGMSVSLRLEGMSRAEGSMVNSSPRLRLSARTSASVTASEGSVCADAPMANAAARTANVCFSLLIGQNTYIRLTAAFVGPK